MNTAKYILEFLKTKHHVVVDGFGIFSLKNVGAVLQEGGRILPPAAQVAFQFNENLRDKEFIRFFAAKENISEFEAEFSLKKITTQWKETLNQGENLKLEGLGDLGKVQDQILMKGERLEELAPDFYGLEEVQINPLHEPQSRDQKTTVNKEVAYRFNNSILWIFLIAVPVLGILYLGITQQDLIFGKKSFDDVGVKPLSTIKPVDSIEQRKPVDSLEKKQDSLQVEKSTSGKPTTTFNNPNDNGE